jgi:hypothetical protein
MKEMKDTIENTECPYCRNPGRYGLLPVTIEPWRNHVGDKVEQGTQGVHSQDPRVWGLEGMWAVCWDNEPITTSVGEVPPQRSVVTVEEEFESSTIN